MQFLTFTDPVPRQQHLWQLLFIINMAYDDKACYGLDWNLVVGVGWDVCLCWGLTSQSTIFQSCRDGATASWVINQYIRGVKCLAQGHNTAAVGIEPPTSRSGVRHSTSEPPRSPCWVGWAWGWWMGCKSSMQLCVFGLSSFPTFLSFLTCVFYSNGST